MPWSRFHNNIIIFYTCLVTPKPDSEVVCTKLQAQNRENRQPIVLRFILAQAFSPTLHCFLSPSPFTHVYLHSIRVRLCPLQTYWCTYCYNIYTYIYVYIQVHILVFSFISTHSHRHAHALTHTIRTAFRVHHEFFVGVE